MPHTSCRALGLSLALLTAGVALAEDTGREVKVGAITMRVPEAWKQQPPSNRLRVAQFSIPAVDGDEQPAELSVFEFGPGGTVSQQVQRWIGQFEPAGRMFKAATGKSTHGEYVYVALSGTYKKPNGPRIQQRTIPMPGARMLVAMIAVEKKGNYFLKLVGHDKTITANTQAFRAAIGASDDERPLALDEE